MRRASRELEMKSHIKIRNKIFDLDIGKQVRVDKYSSA